MHTSSRLVRGHAGSAAPFIIINQKIVYHTPLGLFQQDWVRRLCRFVGLGSASRAGLLTQTYAQHSLHSRQPPEGVAWEVWHHHIKAHRSTHSTLGVFGTSFHSLVQAAEARAD
eukprot:558983-Pelagomonas_calceolata.AAC.1